VEMVDRAIDLVTSGTCSTKATSAGITETQFVADHCSERKDGVKSS